MILLLLTITGHFPYGVANDGAFVVATLCERAAESEELKATLKKWFSSKIQKELAADKDRRGRSLLLAQLEKLS